MYTSFSSDVFVLRNSVNTKTKLSKNRVSQTKHSVDIWMRVFNRVLFYFYLFNTQLVMKTFAQALQEFKSQDPMVTLGDLQSFTLEWEAAMDSLESQFLPDWLSIKDFEYTKSLYNKGEKLNAVKHIYSFAQDHMPGGALKWSKDFIENH